MDDSDMSKITDFAEGRACTARISGVCNNDPTTTVWAHLNSIRWGAGRGHKAPDVCGLVACANCHDVIDGRVRTSYDREWIKQLAYEGHMESLALLVKHGVIGEL